MWTVLVEGRNVVNIHTIKTASLNIPFQPAVYNYYDRERYQFDSKRIKFISSWKSNWNNKIKTFKKTLFKYYKLIKSINIICLSCKNAKTVIMGAKDSKISTILYEDAIKRSKIIISSKHHLVCDWSIGVISINRQNQLI